MATEQDYNSDDLTFSDPEVPEKEDYRRGVRASASMKARAESIRVSSKREFKQLQFTNSLTPEGRRFETLWIRRFEGFRKDVLKSNIERPFEGDDLIGFFDSVLSEVEVDPNKSRPNVLTIKKANSVLIAYGQFTWSKKDGFDIDDHDEIRFKCWVDQATVAGRLRRGHWTETQALEETQAMEEESIETREDELELEVEAAPSRKKTKRSSLATA